MPRKARIDASVISGTSLQFCTLEIAIIMLLGVRDVGMSMAELSRRLRLSLSGVSFSLKRGYVILNVIIILRIFSE